MNDNQKKNIFQRFEAWAHNLGKLRTPDDRAARIFSHDEEVHARLKVLSAKTPEQLEEGKRAHLEAQNSKIQKWREAVGIALAQRNTVTMEDFSAQISEFETAVEAMVHQKILGNTANTAVTSIAKQAYYLELAKLQAMVFSPDLKGINQVAMEFYEKIHGEKADV